VNWPTSRLALSKGASLYVRLFTGMDVKDPTAGFVCYSRKVLEAINLDQIKFVGYAFQIEMKYASYRLGFKIKEVPIIFQDRQKGKSKMNIFIIREALTGVFAMRFLHSYKRYVKN
jgi:dolichol-phosphate mannosyltransferase